MFSMNIIIIQLTKIWRKYDENMTYFKIKITPRHQRIGLCDNINSNIISNKSCLPRKRLGVVFISETNWVLISNILYHIASQLVSINLIKGTANDQDLKYIKCCNFWNIINAKYIIIYICWKKMGQRFHFWHQILLKIPIFGEMAKTTFLTQHF